MGVLLASTGPIDLTDLGRRIPAHCFLPSTRRSVSYLLLDLAILGALYAAALANDSWLLRPFLWAALGTMFFSLYVIGHDCGHGAFSRHPRLNSLVGNLTNALVLVPYHSWRLSHRIHHRHAGDVERDEGWHPITRSQYREMGWASRLLRFRLFPLAFPFYLLRRTFGRTGSHYNPWSPLFRPQDRRAVSVSLLWCGVALALIVSLARHLGGTALFDLYVLPYIVFVMWIDVVTYLHHYDPENSWYRGNAWSFEKGALTAVDRNYGVLSHIHHHIGTHVVHHLFPRIPHYHLREATEAIRPALGDRYQQSREPVWRALLGAWRACHIVPDEGDLVRPEYGQKAGALSEPTGSSSASI